MSRRRVHAADFIRLLESTTQPLYVLDDSLTILYLNEACRGWLGAGTDDLLGRTCLYHSGEETSPADRAAAGLCPPPSVLEGKETAAAVSYVAEEQIRFRAARFVPLRWADEPALCIIALVAGEDTAEPAAEPSGAVRDEAQQLHLRLQQFRQQKQLRRRAHGIVGVSPAARRAAAQAELAAATRANVLVVGPSGSGRRHLAEALHYASFGGSEGAIPIFAATGSWCPPGHPLAGRGEAKTGQSPSPRSDAETLIFADTTTGPDPRHLIPLECGLLDADLIQSTLREAASAPGKAGTLLLCDADRLPPEAQTVLAAALASAGFVWRVIATAAAPLSELVRHGLFREDLDAALSTITIELPPLAKRRDDLPLLAQALLEEQNARGGKQLGGFAPDALDLLCAYSWPGNLAELAQVVAESHVRAAGAHVARADVPERLHAATEAAIHPRRKDEPIQLDEFIARIERELIRRALARSRGNKAKAARLLGLNRPRLYRRMVQLGLIENEGLE